MEGDPAYNKTIEELVALIPTELVKKVVFKEQLLKLYELHQGAGGKLAPIDYFVNFFDIVVPDFNILSHLDNKLNLGDDYYSEQRYQCKINTLERELHFITVVHQGDLLKTPDAEQEGEDVFGNPIYSEYVCEYHGELLEYW